MPHVDGLEHPARQHAGGHFLAAGVDVGEAAIEGHGAERGDQRRDLAVGDQEAVDAAEHAADDQRHDDEDRPDALMLGGEIRGQIGGEAHDRADRDIEVAGDQHDRLRRGDDRQDRGVGDDGAEVLSVEELRRENREDGAENHQEGDDAADAEFQRELAEPAARRLSGDGGGFSRHGPAPAELRVAAIMIVSWVAVAASISSTSSPSAMTRMRSLIASTSGRSDEMTRMARPVVGKLGDDVMDLRLGADIDAVRRLVENEHGGLGRQPFGEGDLLAVPAGQQRHHLVDAGGAHVVGRQRFLGDGALRGGIEHAEMREFADDRQRDVGDDRFRHDQALASRSSGR